MFKNDYGIKEICCLSQRKQVEEAARVLGIEVRFVMAGTDADLEPAFAGLASLGTDALLISADPVLQQPAPAAGRLGRALHRPHHA